MAGRSHADAGGHEAPLAYHARMLLDPHRMDAYERAIRALVRPGDVVLDVGCGTGILAMLAARRGARVHAVESMPIADLARELIDCNRLADRVTLHRADIRTLLPVEPVSLIVSDFLGAFLVDDQMLPAIEAAGRWLAPGGRCCPSEVRLFVAPADVRIREVELWREPFHGIELAAGVPHALAEASRIDVGPAVQLGPAVPYASYEPPAAFGPCDHAIELAVTRAGTLRALLGWFEATLAPGITLSTAPGIQTHWGQYAFPVPPTELVAGERIEVQLSFLGGEWSWRGRVFRDGAERATFAVGCRDE